MCRNAQVSALTLDIRYRYIGIKTSQRNNSVSDAVLMLKVPHIAKTIASRFGRRRVYGRVRLLGICVSCNDQCTEASSRPSRIGFARYVCAEERIHVGSAAVSRAVDSDAMVKGSIKGHIGHGGERQLAVPLPEDAEDVVLVRDRLNEELLLGGAD